jgi:hypothetical protein
MVPQVAISSSIRPTGTLIGFSGLVEFSLRAVPGSWDS